MPWHATDDDGGRDEQSGDCHDDTEDGGDGGDLNTIL